MNKVDIKDVLAALMKQKKVKQTAVAADSGVPQPTISRILKGTHKTLELQTLQRLADYFQVSLDQLVGKEPLDSDPQWHQVKSMWINFEPIQKKAAVGSLKGLAESDIAKNPAEIVVEAEPKQPVEFRPQPKPLGDERRQRENHVAHEQRKNPWSYNKGGN